MPPPEGEKRRRRVPSHERTLLCFVQALVGMRTIVELRDDVAIKGVLVDVPMVMNTMVPAIKNAIAMSSQ